MADTIIESFDIWTHAQGIKSKGRVKSIENISLEGVTKLRELILELAMRGKLVPQDLNDESANKLLNRIEVEKNRLVEEGKLKEIQTLPKVKEQEKPFSLPTGWEWTKIRNIGHDWGQKIPDKDFIYIDVSAVDNLKGELTTPTILKANDAPSRARKIVKYGTVIYSTVRPYLKNISVINEEYLPEPIASTAFAVLHPFLNISGKFIFFYLRSPIFVKYVESVQTGIAYPAINDKQFYGGLIPLPPIEEQTRIVAKVEELMTLCDKLEEKKTNNLKTHQILVKTLLKSLTQAKNADQFQTAWLLISVHFDTLFCTEDSVDQLKQAILKLAIMGRLEKQYSSDEPACELVKKIEKEKAKLLAEGKIKKEKPLPKITDEEKYFELPKGWQWERLNNIIDVRDGTHDSPKDAMGGNTFPLITSKDFENGSINFDNARRISEQDHIEISKRSRVEKFDILFSMIGGNLGNQVIVTDERQFSIKNLALFKYYCKEYTSPLFIKKITEYLGANLQNNAIGGAQPFVALGYLRRIVIALPPIEEQKRIVTKVDQLMSFCDELKDRIIKSQQIQDLLSKTIFENAVA